MSEPTDEALARRDRLIAFNEYVLTVDELAMVAYLATAHTDPHDSAASRLAERLWDDLIAVNSQLAEQVWEAARVDGLMSNTMLVAIASSLSQHNKETR